jgi:hypothetical protein
MVLLFPLAKKRKKVRAGISSSLLIERGRGIKSNLAGVKLSDAALGDIGSFYGIPPEEVESRINRAVDRIARRDGLMDWLKENLPWAAKLRRKSAPLKDVRRWYFKEIGDEIGRCNRRLEKAGVPVRFKRLVYPWTHANASIRFIREKGSNVIHVVTTVSDSTGLEHATGFTPHECGHVASAEERIEETHRETGGSAEKVLKLVDAWAREGCPDLQRLLDEGHTIRELFYTKEGRERLRGVLDKVEYPEDPWSTIEGEKRASDYVPKWVDYKLKDPKRLNALKRRLRIAGGEPEQIEALSLSELRLLFGLHKEFPQNMNIEPGVAGAVIYDVEKTMKGATREKKLEEAARRVWRGLYTKKHWKDEELKKRVRNWVEYIYSVSESRKDKERDLLVTAGRAFIA